MTGTLTVTGTATLGVTRPFRSIDNYIKRNGQFRDEKVISCPTRFRASGNEGTRLNWMVLCTFFILLSQMNRVSQVLVSLFF